MFLHFCLILDYSGETDDDFRHEAIIQSDKWGIRKWRQGKFTECLRMCPKRKGYYFCPRYCNFCRKARGFIRVFSWLNYMVIRYYSELLSFLLIIMHNLTFSGNKKVVEDLLMTLKHSQDGHFISKVLVKLSSPIISNLLNFREIFFVLRLFNRD